jgi:hypothetical protein
MSGIGKDGYSTSTDEVDELMVMSSHDTGLCRPRIEAMIHKFPHPCPRFHYSNAEALTRLIRLAPNPKQHFLRHGTQRLFVR